MMEKKQLPRFVVTFIVDDGKKQLPRFVVTFCDDKHFRI